MANIFKRPSHKAKLGYNGFDLSKRILFTSSVGQLLPVFYDFASPGEKYKLNDSIFTRTQPLRTSAFVRIREHVDWFFVPMQHIDSYFGSRFYGIQDLGSSALSDPSYPGGNSTMSPLTLIPSKSFSIDPQLFMQGIRNTFARAHYATPTEFEDYIFCPPSDVDNFGVPNMYNFFRLASLLGYGEQLPTNLSIWHTAEKSNTPQNVIIDFPSVNLNLFYAYQKIWFDYYRLTDWTPNAPEAWNYDKLSIKYSSASNDDKPSSSFTVENFLTDGLFGNSESAKAEFRRMPFNSPFSLRYRPYKKDYFTNVMPSPLGAGQSAIGSTQVVDDKGDYLYQPNNPESPFDYNNPIGGNFNNNGPSPVVTGESTQSSTVGTSQFSLADLRSAFAWEKMLRITMQAGKHYDAQTSAHFGYSVPKGISNEVYHIGSHSSIISIGEVVSTATTGDGGAGTSVLGELAGKGIGSSGKNETLNFTAPCHGYLMAIYSAVPDVDYRANGIDFLNTIGSINDYYHPEFDTLGMEYLPLYSSSIQVFPGPFSVSHPKIIGWTYRYYGFKTKYDTIHGAFNYTLRDWVAPRDNYGIYSPYPVTGNTYTYQDFVMNSFYVSPSILDSVMSINFKPELTQMKLDNPVVGDKYQLAYKMFKTSLFANDPHKLSSANGTDFNLSYVFERDPLLHALDIKCYKSSTMSVYGLPNL